ncbi:Hypothetical predicted protein [Paramuricea clavata]|uniref:Uncharacterized protein n=1 Tax=Paramuricea clavata TaxID=317549 RepID=A0A6S7HKQ8_PARCT|nr:Hypothetical predicted protein [Paramuricea clavata]
MAVLYHSCELPDDKKRHKYCPLGPDSWCSYEGQGTLPRKDHNLDAVFLERLRPEFTRLNEYSLLFRCLPGYSQNVNGSLNSLVYGTVPLKTACGMCNDVDPLGYVASSSDDDSIDDDYPLSRLLADGVSDDSDDAPLAQLISKRQQK